MHKQEINQLDNVVRGGVLGWVVGIFISLCVVAALSLVSCDAPMTRPEQVEAAQLDVEIAAGQGQLTELEQMAKVLVAELQDSDPSNDASAGDALQGVVAQIEALSDGLDAKLERREKLLEQATGRATDTATGLARLIPGWGVLAGAVAPLLIGFFTSKRQNAHLKDVGTALLRRQWLAALASFAKAYGWKRTAPVDRAASTPAG
jgi:hypothetical protein